MTLDIFDFFSEPEEELDDPGDRLGDFAPKALANVFSFKPPPEEEEEEGKDDDEPKLLEMELLVKIELLLVCQGLLGDGRELLEELQELQLDEGRELLDEPQLLQLDEG